MFDLNCPVCGKQYHADEVHLGKFIQCQTPGCKEIITIARHDGRYTTSNQQIETKDTRRPKSVTADEIHRRGDLVSKRKWNHSIVLIGTIVLLLGIGLATYKWGAPKGTLKPKSAEPVALSSDEIGVAGDNAPAKQSSQLPNDVQGPETLTPIDGDVHKPIPAVTFDPSTAVGLNDKPLNNPIRIRRTEPPAISLPTGTRIIADQATAGRGELEAINGTRFDAVVIVIHSNTQERIRKVYIRSQDSFTLEHLNPGDYQILFATGADWNNSEEHFNRNASYFEFGKILSFHEEGNSYEEHSITLNPVVNGNVRAKSISEAEFHALVGKR
jgi:hypothetical protein